MQTTHLNKNYTQLFHIRSGVRLTFNRHSWIILFNRLPLLDALTARATKRTKTAFRPSTAQSHNTHFRCFIAFCIFVKLDCTNVTVHLILSFLEFLVHNGKSYAIVGNALSAIKAQLLLHNIDCHCFLDKRISYYMKALRINRPFKAVLRPVIDIPLLKNISLTCDSMYLGHIFKAVYLVALFSFLRISNLVSHSIATYSHLKQLARADVIFAPPGALLIIKWSKTLQANNKAKVQDSFHRKCCIMSYSSPKKCSKKYSMA